jgi:hypothetical protein
MNFRSMLVAVILLAFVLPAMAQPAEARNLEVEPPQLQTVVALTRPSTDGEIASLLAVKPEIPLGPIDVLKGYENEMTAVADRISAELARISQAVRLGQISRAEAEYLTQETYQLAIMQYQVLSTLHDSLAHDMAQAAIKSKRSPTEDGSDTTVVVHPPFAVEEQSQ